MRGSLSHLYAVPHCVRVSPQGLEEANQSLNKNKNREDEEERMAADAEKRKRLLLANSVSNTGDATPTRRAKLLMLGDSGVGKSSLIMRWTLDSFSPSLVSTVGVNFKSRKVNIGSEAVQVQVWDTAGQEQFHKITTSYYKGAQGIMLVYDVTDTASLANIEYWIKNIKSHAADTVQVALIGNKTDLRPTAGSPTNAAEGTKKWCDTSRGQEIAQKYGIPFFETSAKESYNVEVAFLTLVEHIVESGGGGTTTAHAHAQSNGLGHTAPGGIAAGAPGSAAGGVTGRSIVEKASEKARMFGGAFKRTPSASAPAGKGGSPPPLPQASAGATGAGSGAGTPASPASGEGSVDGADPNGVDKEKCVIS
jgi:Ras-related protein Rab-8A